MSMISRCQSKFDILSFKLNQFEIYPHFWNIIDQTSIEYSNFLEEHVLLNFTKCFSGTRVNQIGSKYLNGYCLNFAICCFLLCKKDFYKTFTWKRNEWCWKLSIRTILNLWCCWRTWYLFNNLGFCSLYMICEIWVFGSNMIRENFN